MLYNKLKEELSENELLLHVDYSENYSNIQPGEIQCTYFGHDSFSVFTTYCYTIFPLSGTLDEWDFS